MAETRGRRRLVGAVAVVLMMLVWQFLPTVAGVPATTFPPADQLGSRMLRMIADEGLVNHFLVTLGEIWRGVLIGLAVGVAAAVLFSKVPLMERLIMPIIVVVQVTPKIAIAPLLVLWLGLGATSKVFLVALVTFFPTLVNTVVGIRSIPTNVLQLCSLLALTPWQQFTKVELPSIVPGVVVGLRLGCLAGVTAAVIGEIIGARAGLGYLVVQSQESGDVARGLAAVVVLSLIGLALWVLTGKVADWAAARFAA